MTLSNRARRSLEESIDGAAKADTPGIIAHVCNSTGDVIFSHYAGLRGVDTKKPLTRDTMFWFASASKLPTAIAVMQLVEQGKLDLDDADVVERLCPELGRLRVLTGLDGEGQPTYEEKQAKITARMLMSHTSGLGYTAFSSLLRKALPEGYNENEGTVEKLCTPLLSQPGADFHYGIGFDWLGIVVERITGQTLHDYMKKNIFGPLGMDDMSMYPRGDQLDRLATLHYRHPQAGIVPVRPDPWEKYGYYSSTPQCQGGTTLFGPATEYATLLTTLLNDGTHPVSGVTILRPETTARLFANRVPQFGTEKRGATDVNPFVLNECDEFSLPGYEHSEAKKDWALGGAVQEEHDTDGKRSEILWWGGATNFYWWIDRERGITGIVASCLMPFFDPAIMNVWKKVMETVNTQTGTEG